jgi:hypothetical protein
LKRLRISAKRHAATERCCFGTCPETVDYHLSLEKQVCSCCGGSLHEMSTEVRQSKMADIIEDEARGAYMAINGLVFQAAKIIGALGIIIGNLIGGFEMALGYLVLGIASILLFKQVLEQKKAMQLTQRKV